MTIEMVLVAARLKELHALGLARRAIVARAADATWLYVVQALDTRLDELRGWLAREDPQIVRDCEALLQPPPPDPSADDEFLRSLFIATE